VVAASPLLVSTDLRNMTAIMKDLLLNKEVLAVHQDLLGKACLDEVLLSLCHPHSRLYGESI
jgi:hypothetical protein